MQNYHYSPFGEIWQGERTNDTNPFRYAGEYLDKETGDIYLRARYYDPSIGRFLSVDPIKDGTNWYVYCSNNPIAFVDPSGLVDVMVEYIAEKNGGTVTYGSYGGGCSKRQKYIIVSIGDISKTYTINMPDSKVSIINGKYVMDNQILESDFHLNDASSKHQEGDLFNSTDDVALAFGLEYHHRSVSEKQEYGAIINVRWYAGDAKFYYSNVTNSSGTYNTPLNELNVLQQNSVALRGYTQNTCATIHTHWHPNGNPKLSSPNDYDEPKQVQTIYLVNKNMEFIKSKRTNAKNNINGFAVGQKIF